jgi:hypothetical protein
VHDGFGESYDDITITVGEVERTADYANWLETYFGDANYDDTQMASNGLYTVREAYVAGVDPTDPTAQFVIEDLGMAPGERVLQWAGVTGRLYSVYWSTNLMQAGGGFQLLQSDIPYHSTTYTTAVEQAQSQGFYRVDVQLE